MQTKSETAKQSINKRGKANERETIGCNCNFATESSMLLSVICFDGNRDG